ncbi:MAG: hypothetical protein AAFP20_16045 [Cyanobacteria bacterium J06614_10]
MSIRSNIGCLYAFAYHSWFQDAYPHKGAAEHSIDGAAEQPLEGAAEQPLASLIEACVLR